LAVVEEVVQEVVEEVVEIENEQLEEGKKSDEDMMKDLYMEQLSTSGIQDKSLVENLRYMMNMGYLNFTINYNLLMRNNNDLVVSINKLCNNIVTESMFEMK